VAKTAAEYQKAYRERKKKTMESSDDQSLRYVSRPISEYFSDGSFVFEESLDAFGVPLTTSELAEPVQRFQSMGLGDVEMTAIERLEGLAGAFQDATVELHELINRYKMAEATRAREELVTTRYESSGAQAQAIDEIARIDKVIASLSRKSRLFLPVIGTNVA
jgi:hypothetical protein